MCFKICKCASHLPVYDKSVQHNRYRPHMFVKVTNGKNCLLKKQIINYIL